MRRNFCYAIHLYRILILQLNQSIRAAETMRQPYCYDAMFKLRRYKQWRYNTSMKLRITFCCLYFKDALLGEQEVIITQFHRSSSLFKNRCGGLHPINMLHGMLCLGRGGSKLYICFRLFLWPHNFLWGRPLETVWEKIWNNIYKPIHSLHEQI